MSTGSTNIDIATAVQDALDAILVRNPSGVARIHRLQYFAENVAIAVSQHGSTALSPTTNRGTASSIVPSSVNGNDLAVSEAIQKAYQAISDTCKSEGNVVRYKMIFGGGTAGNASATMQGRTNAGMFHHSAPEITHHSGNSSGEVEPMDPMVISNSPNSNNTSPSNHGGQQAQQREKQPPNVTPSGVVEYDASWVDEQDALARQSRDVLEHRLQVAQSQLHKESIRTAYLALSQAQFSGNTSGGGTGDLVQAFHALLRAKDYCTSRQQTTAVCLQIVSVALALGNTVAAAEYIHKLEHTLRSITLNSGSASINNNNNTAPGSSTGSSPSSTSSMELDLILVQTALALERMLCGNFRAALQALMKVVQHEEMETAFTVAVQDKNLPYWVAPQDVSLYAAFLCLCHGTAAEMTALADHVSALEWVPLLRQCLVDFGHAQYQACWNCVAVQLPIVLATDPFLGPFVPQLLAGIRRKVLQQYWRAYSRVPLTVMAQDLGSSLVPSVDALRQEWMNMILQEQQQRHAVASSTGSGMKDDGLVGGSESVASYQQQHQGQQSILANTRLNLVTDTLHRDTANDHDLTSVQNKLRSQKLSQLTQQVMDDSYAMIIRLACQESDIQVLSAAAAAAYGREGGSPEHWRPTGGRRGFEGGGGRVLGGGGRGFGGSAMDDDDEEEDEEEDELVMMAGGPGVVGMAGGVGVAVEDDDAAVVDAMNPEDLY